MGLTDQGHLEGLRSLGKPQLLAGYRLDDDPIPPHSLEGISGRHGYQRTPGFGSRGHAPVDDLGSDQWPGRVMDDHDLTIWIEGSKP